MNTKLQTSVQFDEEFLDTVRYYMPEREEMKNKIRQLFYVFRDEDLCRIEDSPKVLSFKRDILAIVARFQHKYYQDIRSDFYVPGWHLDDCAMACASRIVKYVDEWWNCGATVEFNGMY